MNEQFEIFTDEEEAFQPEAETERETEIEEPAPKQAETPKKTVDLTRSQLALNNTMRLLWVQHVEWTRMFLISLANNLGDLSFVTKRLLRNPSDFANALMPYYGKEKSEKFGQLLTQHLLIAAQLAQAAKAGDSKAVMELRKKWYANADEIAAYLASINPFWSKAEWQKLLYDHLAMTENEAVYLLQKKYQASIDEYDKIEQEAMKMADYMTYGIMKQFPNAFTF